MEGYSVFFKYCFTIRTEDQTLRTSGVVFSQALCLCRIKKVPCIINDVIEIKQVSGFANDNEFAKKFADTIVQAQDRCHGDLAGCRPVAICFRGNKGYKIHIPVL